MKRWWMLITVTFIMVTFALLTFKFGLGWKSLLPKRKEGPLTRDPIAWAKFMQINYLAPIGRKRPYTEQEMNLLRQAISDPDKYVRVVAIAALWEAKHDPKQREEAIRLVIPCLKDPEWIVRAYAVKAMFWLEAKEAIPYLLPLLNDPKPEVREDVKKTLKKLGYQVHEK